MRREADTDCTFRWPMGAHHRRRHQRRHHQRRHHQRRGQRHHQRRHQLKHRRSRQPSHQHNRQPWWRFNCIFAPPNVLLKVTPEATLKLKANLKRILVWISCFGGICITDLSAYFSVVHWAAQKSNWITTPVTNAITNPVTNGLTNTLTMPKWKLEAICRWYGWYHLLSEYHSSIINQKNSLE